MSTSIAEEVQRVLAELSPEERDRIQPRLNRLIIHREAVRRFPTPGHIGQLLSPGFMQTPMLDAIDDAIMQAEQGLQDRWVINTPPQEGKTTRLQAAGLWLLLRRPHLRIAYASYEQGIAARSGLTIRQGIETHGSGYFGAAPDPEREDVLGLMLDPNRAMQTSWSLADLPGKPKHGRLGGGVISVGIGSAFTGRPADVLIVDDPLKDAKAADSPVIRKAAIDWFQSVATTRLAPGAIVIIVQTRWHEDDLSGWVLAEDSARSQRRYRHLNIPAQAESSHEPGKCPCRDCAGQPDVLGREPGEYLLSARERTPEQWEQVKIDVGTRWWFALYQGRPAPPEGGIFKRVWFNKHRVAEAPELVHILTMVDPADNEGDGDEAGIITGGIDAHGEIYVLADDSGHYTVARWVRVAIFAMIRHKAGQLAYERSLSGLKRSIANEWKILRRQARTLAHRGPDLGQWTPAPDTIALAKAVEDLADEEDTAVELAGLRRDLAELWPHVPAILAMPQAGPHVKPIRAEGTKSYRAHMVSPTCEQGQVHHVGHMVKLEHQACTWLVSQDSPDRMDAWVHLITELSANGGGSAVRSASNERPFSARQAGVPALMRSTRGGR